MNEPRLPDEWIETAMPFLERLSAHHGGTGNRYARTRNADREPLPEHRRLLVLKRDRFTCQFCHQWGGTLEIDHIVPWSAGGSDEPTNLRTLCQDCNQRRSNRYAIGDETPALSATWSCGRCAGVDTADDEPRFYNTAYCGRCDQISYVATEE